MQDTEGFCSCSSTTGVRIFPGYLCSPDSYGCLLKLQNAVFQNIPCRGLSMLHWKKLPCRLSCGDESGKKQSEHPHLLQILFHHVRVQAASPRLQMRQTKTRDPFRLESGPHQDVFLQRLSEHNPNRMPETPRKGSHRDMWRQAVLPHVQDCILNGA